MNTKMILLTSTLVASGCLLPVYAGDDSASLLQDALSAAPPTLRDKVTVVDWNKNVLQKGDSGYTCFPTPPQLQGTAPMCMDAPGGRLDE